MPEKNKDKKRQQLEGAFRESLTDPFYHNRVIFTLVSFCTDIALYQVAPLSVFPAVIKQFFKLRKTYRIKKLIDKLEKDPIFVRDFGGIQDRVKVSEAYKKSKNALSEWKTTSTYQNRPPFPYQRPLNEIKSGVEFPFVIKFSQKFDLSPDETQKISEEVEKYKDQDIDYGILSALVGVPASILSICLNYEKKEIVCNNDEDLVATFEYLDKLDVEGFLSTAKSIYREVGVKYCSIIQFLLVIISLSAFGNSPYAVDQNLKNLLNAADKSKTPKIAFVDSQRSFFGTSINEALMLDKLYGSRDSPSKDYDELSSSNSTQFPPVNPDSVPKIDLARFEYNPKHTTIPRYIPTGNQFAVTEIDNQPKIIQLSTGSSEVSQEMQLTDQQGVLLRLDSVTKQRLLKVDELDYEQIGKNEPITTRRITTANIKGKEYAIVNNTNSTKNFERTGVSKVLYKQIKFNPDVLRLIDSENPILIGSQSIGFPFKSSDDFLEYQELLKNKQSVELPKEMYPLFKLVNKKEGINGSLDIHFELPFDEYSLKQTLTTIAIKNKTPKMVTLQSWIEDKRYSFNRATTDISYQWYAKSNLGDIMLPPEFKLPNQKLPNQSSTILKYTIIPEPGVKLDYSKVSSIINELDNVKVSIDLSPDVVFLSDTSDKGLLGAIPFSDTKDVKLNPINNPKNLNISSIPGKAELSRNVNAQTDLAQTTRTFQNVDQLSPNTSEAKAATYDLDFQLRNKAINYRVKNTLNQANFPLEIKQKVELWRQIYINKQSKIFELNTRLQTAAEQEKSKPELDRAKQDLIESIYKINQEIADFSRSYTTYAFELDLKKEMVRNGDDFIANAISIAKHIENGGSITCGPASHLNQFMLLAVFDSGNYMPSPISVTPLMRKGFLLDSDPDTINSKDAHTWNEILIEDQSDATNNELLISDITPNRVKIIKPSNQDDFIKFVEDNFLLLVASGSLLIFARMGFLSNKNFLHFFKKYKINSYVNKINKTGTWMKVEDEDKLKEIKNIIQTASDLTKKWETSEIIFCFGVIDWLRNIENDKLSFNGEYEKKKLKTYLSEYLDYDLPRSNIQEADFNLKNTQDILKYKDVQLTQYLFNLLSNDIYEKSFSKNTKLETVINLLQDLGKSDLAKKFESVATLIGYEHVEENAK